MRIATLLISWVRKGKMFFGCLSLLAFSLSQASCTATQVSAYAPGASPTPSTSLELSDCQLTTPGTGISISARCGTLRVFEDQKSKTGREISLNIAVLPATRRTPKPDPLVLLAGGPGQAATQAFPPLLPSLDKINQERDILMVDQRGTGDSQPLSCTYPEGGEDQTSEASLDRLVQDIEDCAGNLGADPRQYTTESAVEDLEQVRQALGYPSINLLGVSYGTRLALAYARQYPQVTRTLTLDSVMPVDWELGSHNPANAQRALDLIFSRCEADSTCRNSFPDLQEEFRALLEELDKNPAEVVVNHPVTGEPASLNYDREKFGTTVQLLSYAPETAALLPLLVHSAYQEKSFDRWAAQYLIVSAGLGESIQNGLYLSVLCAEDAAFYTDPPAPAASYLPDHVGQMEQLCQAWPHEKVTDAFKQPVQSPVPVLILSGEADPVTPPENGQQVARTLENSKQIVLPGMGHSVFFRGCLPGIIADFIASASLQDLNPACTQTIRPQPFFLDYAGPMP